MTEEKTNQKEIAELNKQLENNENSAFEEIKQKYENIIAEKNKEIDELNKTVELTNQRVETTVNELNDEVIEKLKQSEELRELQKNVDELLKEKAEVTVDTYIQKGIIPSAKRDIAVKLCLNDNDTFMELYRDAKPIIEIDPQPRSHKVTDLNEIVEFFKQK